MVVRALVEDGRKQRLAPESQISRLLANHDRRRVRIASRDPRRDGGVGDAKGLDAGAESEVELDVRPPVTRPRAPEAAGLEEAGGGWAGTQESESSL